MHRYYLDFILVSRSIDENALRNTLTEFGMDLEVHEMLHSETHPESRFRVSINTEDPTIIFDVCAQYGRLSSIKIDEQKRTG
jgi:dihydroxyacetone kinase-like predicted kinase